MISTVWICVSLYLQGSVWINVNQVLVTRFMHKWGVQAFRFETVISSRACTQSSHAVHNWMLKSYHVHRALPSQLSSIYNEAQDIKSLDLK